MNRDVLCYGTVLAGSVFFLFAAKDIAVTEASLASSAFFPRILLGALVALSATGLYKTVRAGAGGKGQKIHSPLLVMLGLCVGFIALLHLAGFVIATTAFIFTASLYMSADYSAKNIALMAGLGFTIAFGINYVFINILMFILP